jgi:hypothetical protein
LTQATINAFSHINIVSSRSATTILSWLGFNRDCQSWTDGLAKFACDATFLAVWIPAQGMLAAKTGAEWTFFKRVVNRNFWLEKIF